MTGACSDARGNVWTYVKLDEILSDPVVQRTVVEAEAVAFGPSGASSELSGERLWDWGRAQGRSAAGMALLLLLMVRSSQLDRGAA